MSRIAQSCRAASTISLTSLVAAVGVAASPAVRADTINLQRCKTSVLELVANYDKFTYEYVNVGLGDGKLLKDVPGWDHSDEPYTPPVRTRSKAGPADISVAFIPITVIACLDEGGQWKIDQHAGGVSEVEQSQTQLKTAFGHQKVVVSGISGDGIGLFVERMNPTGPRSGIINAQIRKCVEPENIGSNVATLLGLPYQLHPSLAAGMWLTSQLVAAWAADGAEIKCLPIGPPRFASFEINANGVAVPTQDPYLPPGISPKDWQLPDRGLDGRPVAYPVHAERGSIADTVDVGVFQFSILPSGRSFPDTVIDAPGMLSGWSTPGYPGSIALRKGGECLHGESKDIRLSDCGKGDVKAQRWSAVRSGRDLLILKNTDTGLCLTEHSVTDGKAKGGVFGTPCDVNDARQRWILTPLADDATVPNPTMFAQPFSVRNITSGRYLDSSEAISGVVTRRDLPSDWNSSVNDAVPIYHRTVPRLTHGMRLPKRTALESPNGIYRAQMVDGSLMILRKTPRKESGGWVEVLWRTNTGGEEAHLDLMTDGRLQIVAADDGKDLWTARSDSGLNAYAVMQNNGSLVVFSRDHGKTTRLWSPPIGAVESYTLYPGGRIRNGKSLKSDNGALQLTMQTDGNLVLSVSGAGPAWASGTGPVADGSFFEAVMQLDGNFAVIDSRDGTVKWASETPGNEGARLLLPDGVVSVEGFTLWEPDL